MTVRKPTDSETGEAHRGRVKAAENRVSAFCAAGLKGQGGRLLSVGVHFIFATGVCQRVKA